MTQDLYFGFAAIIGFGIVVGVAAAMAFKKARTLREEIARERHEQMQQAFKWVAGPGQQAATKTTVVGAPANWSRD